MFNGPESRPAVSWPTVIVTVLAVLAVVQMIRVNLPRRPERPGPNLYTQDGAVLAGPLTIAPGDFHSVRIDLNRTARLSGFFRTGSLDTNVEALVLAEDDFFRWRENSDHAAAARTGSIPGGRLNIRLGPGTYFLVLDNRPSAWPAANIAAWFAIE